jgi:hypothetical protein
MDPAIYRAGAQRVQQKNLSPDKGRKALRFRGTTFIPPAVQTLAALAGS